MAGDIQVTLSLLLEDQASIAQQLQAAGGSAGQKFYDGLSGPTKKAFDDLVRQADDAAKKVGLTFNKTTLKFETASGNIIPPSTLNEIAKINAGFREAKQAVDIFKTATASAAKEAAQNFNILESAITGVAISLTSRLTDALVGSLGSVRQLLGGYMELDGELRLAAAAAGETGGYERLGAIVDKVGIEAAGTTKQVAELATSLVRAGFSVSEVEGALPGVVKGAEATGTTFERMGDIVGNTLRGFALDIDQTSRVTDVLVNAANSSNASIEGLGYTFEYTAPIAKALGVSLEDVAAAAGLMANAGIQGSVAGTGLRFGLQKLQQAAGGASPEILGLSRNQERLGTALKKLGADVTDAEGNLLPLEQVFLRLKSSLSQLSRADQVRIMNIIFGEEAGSKFLSITNQSTAAISKMFGEIRNSAGSTDKARKDMTGFGLEVKRLEGTIDSLLRGVGGVAAAALSPLLTAANATIGVISGLPAPIKNTAGAMAIMATAATAASVGIGALNVAVGTIGGWAALRTSILSVAAALTGPVGAGSIAILGIAAAAYGLYGAFNGVDKTTKTLIQTMTGLATFVAVIRGLAAAQRLWAAATAATGAALTFVTALGGPSGLARIAVATAAASAAYYGMSKIIKETGADTNDLSEKSKALKGEIEKLGAEIEQGRKLKIDTSEAEKLKALKENELRQLENPLEIKLNIEKAEAQIQSLNEQISKMRGGFLGLFGNQDNVDPKLEAQLKAAEKYRDVLKATDQGTKSNAFATLDDSAKKFVITQTGINKQIEELQKKKVSLPVDAKVNREAIDKEIAGLSNLKGKNDIKFRANLDVSTLKAQLAQVDAERKKLENTTIRDDGSFKSIASREEEKKQKINTLVQRQLNLQTAIGEAQSKLVESSEKQATAAKKQVLTEEKKLEIAKTKLSNEQQSIELANRLMGLDKGRLQTVQQIADAYASLANAQAALTQSQFDVESARNNKGISTAEQELQAMRDRGASLGEIKAKEDEIKELKKNGEQIEKAAMAAAIESAAKRFEIERKVLELKQAAQALEQQSALRASQKAVLEERKQLVELQSKAKDPSLAPEQKAAIAEQIKLQQESLQLSIAQVAADKERIQSLSSIFGLERQSLDAQQQTQANQFRSGAAGKGWEGDMAGGLDKLDRQAGVTYKTFQKLVGSIEIPGRPIENIYETVVQVEDATKKSTVAWDDVNKAAQKVLGTINDHNKAIDEGKKKVSELAAEYGKGVKGGQGGDANSGTEADGKAKADAEAKASADKKVETNRTANKRILSDNEKMFSQMIEKEREHRGKDFTYLYTPDFVYIKAPEQKGPGPSWYSEEELAGIKKIQNATKQSADEFFAASSSATYLERALKAVGKEASVLEKQRFFAQAMSDADNNLIPGFTNMANDNNAIQGGPENYMDAALKLAKKQSLDWNDPFVESKQFLDQYAASLVDNEARTQGLKGAIAGLRDEIGRPVDTSSFNFGEIHKGFIEDARKALSPEAVKEAMEKQDFSLLPKKQEIDITVNPDVSGLANVKDQISQTTDAAAAFNTTLNDALGGASSNFYAAANSIIPFSSGLQDTTKSLQDLGYTDIKNPFESWQSSVDQTATGINSIASSFGVAGQNAEAFSQSLPDAESAQRLQAAYSSLSTTQPPDISQAANEQSKLTDDTQIAIDKTLELSSTWDLVKDKIQNSVSSLQQFSIPTARWAGGWLAAGQTATVNELGLESFLSSSGVLSLIRAPQYGQWTPPSSGMVLPAGLTARLEAVGAFDHSHGNAKGMLLQPAVVMPTNRTVSSGASHAVAIRRLQKSIDKLEKAMSSYKPPDVHVNLPGNERLLGVASRIL